MTSNLTMNFNEKSANNSTSSVQLSAEAVRINGQSEILLCASLFYFRIPRELWKERLEQLKAFGYNGIDVYFPWNFHEPEEGKWEFSGERDVEAFLQTVKEAGLWVVARPGPYICSEWDGGALPAYLNVKEGLKIRDNDPQYLGYVSEWFARILPILKKHQFDEGGTVILVQLDNELDFYGCTDPQGYIAALREMSLAHGISVPLIACAGQGGLYGASGFAERVLPTCNFYPDDKDPVFEEKVIHYRQRLAERNIPLLVTETNRSHFLLRRLLSCGAKLLGPYLQVSGTDFGFTNATNNWGDPLAFLTSDYDFGGMISPEGRIRPEAYEGRLMSRMIRTYGVSLAEAVPAEDHDAPVIGYEIPDTVVVPAGLNLKQGGRLVFLTNTGDDKAEVTLRQDGVVTKSIVLAANRSIAVPFGIPLDKWNLPGTLLYSTAELFMSRTDASITVLVFHTESEGEMVFHFDEQVAWTADGGTLESDGKRMKFTFGNERQTALNVSSPEGHRLLIVVMDRASALCVEEIEPNGHIRIGQMLTYDDRPSENEMQWRMARLDPVRSMAASAPKAIERADFLEKFGIYRGYAWYEAIDNTPAGKERKGFLVQQGSDVVSVYAGAAFAGTVTPAGESEYLPCAGTGSGRCMARVEIWGHSNFDDARKPGLRLNALKGMKGLVSVTDVRDINQNWRLYRSNEREIREELTAPALDDSNWPMVGFGGWLAADSHSFEYFRKTFKAADDADSWTLEIAGLQGMAQIYVNGVKAGLINPFDPFLDMTPFVVPGKLVHLTVYLERLLGFSAGNPKVHEGNAATDWQVSACGGEGELLNHARLQEDSAIDIRLPLTLQPGEVSWLFGKVKSSGDGGGWRVRSCGSGLKLTVFFNNRLVGRLWLPGGKARPAMKGGDPESFYLPGPWFGDSDGELAILLEAVDRDQSSVIEQFLFIPA